ALLDAGGDVHRQGPFLADPAGAVTGRARILDGLATALAGGAGALDGEEALAGAHLADAAGGGAGAHAGARLGAGAGAGLAGDAGGHADLGGLALERLLQRDLHIVAQVGAAVARVARAPASAAAAPAHEVAEQIVEDVRHGRGEI